MPELGASTQYPVCSPKCLGGHPAHGRPESPRVTACSIVTPSFFLSGHNVYLETSNRFTGG